MMSKKEKKTYNAGATFVKNTIVAFVLSFALIVSFLPSGVMTALADSLEERSAAEMLTEDTTGVPVVDDVNTDADDSSAQADGSGESADAQDAADEERAADDEEQAAGDEEQVADDEISKAAAEPDAGEKPASDNQASKADADDAETAAQPNKKKAKRAAAKGAADGSAVAPSIDDTGIVNPVSTINNPVNTTIDVFDYWVQMQDAADSPHSKWDWDNDANSGINEDHPLKFRIWDADTNSNGDWDSRDKGAANYYTGDGHWGNAPVMSGIVASELGDDGYPVLSENGSVNHPTIGNINMFDPNVVAVGSSGGSLGYLFDPDDTTNGKASYAGANGLFQVDDEGYYVYDSAENAARLYGSEGNYQFAVGDAEYIQPKNPEGESEGYNAGFWPFGTDSNRHYFGLRMKTEFSQPSGGQVLNPSGVYQPMKFNFTGDDDVWLYLDGVLVGDLGGVHQPSSLEINFQNGDVLVNGTKVGTIKSFYEAAGKADDYQWNGDTFADGTNHDMDFFYMERGNGDSNMKIRYNLVSTGDFTAHKSLRRGEGDPVLQSGDFDFDFIGYDGLYHWDSYNHEKNYREHWTDADSAEFIALINGGANKEAGRLAPMPNGDPATHVSESGGYQIMTEPVVADGNINFGSMELGENSFDAGDFFIYRMREVVPDDAVQRTVGDDGTVTEVTYGEATAEQRAEGGFVGANGVTYTNREYYYAGLIGQNDDGTKRLVKVYLQYDPETGKFTDTDKATRFANFENTYRPGVTPMAKKTLTGSELKAGQFEFGVYTDQECTQLAKSALGKDITAKNDARGNVKFDRIEFAEDDIAGMVVGQSKTFTYYVKEIIPEDATDNGDGTWTLGRTTYDGSVHKLEATYTLQQDPDDETSTVYSVSVNYVSDEGAKAASFVNETEVFTPYEIDAKKVLKKVTADGEEDVNLGSRKFHFTLVEVDANGNPVAGGITLEATNDARGNIVFADDSLEFTGDGFANGATVAHKYFKITEVQPQNPSSVVGPDGKTYTNVSGGVDFESGNTAVTVTAHMNDEQTKITVDDPVYGTIGDEGDLTAEYVPSASDQLVGVIRIGVSGVSANNATISAVSDGAPLPNSTTVAVPSGASSVDFAGITFSEPGDYVYEITAGNHTCTLNVHVAQSGGSIAAPVEMSYIQRHVGNQYSTELSVDVTVTFNDSSNQDKYFSIFTTDNESWSRGTIGPVNGAYPNSYNKTNIQLWTDRYGKDFVLYETDQWGNKRSTEPVARLPFTEAESGSTQGVPDTTTSSSSDMYIPPDEAVFVNRLLEDSSASITVKKLVTGAYSDMTKKFTFSISGADGATCTINGEEAQLADDATFELGHQDEAVFTGIAAGAQVVVSENDSSAAGYTTTVECEGCEAAVSGRAASIESLQGDDTVVTFTNEANVTPPTGLSDTAGQWAALALAALAALGAIGVLWMIRRRKRA